MKVMANTAFITFKAAPKDDPTIKKIKEFGAFEAGWSGEEGEAFSKSQIDRALSVHELMQQNGYSATDAFPGLTGEIAVTAYKDNYFLQFVVEKQGQASILVKAGTATLAREYRISEKEARAIFLAASRTVWGISEVLISRNITTAGLGESTSWHLDTRKTLQGFPFSYATA
jgi:hypothetical protein